MNTQIPYCEATHMLHHEMPGMALVVALLLASCTDGPAAPAAGASETALYSSVPEGAPPEFSTSPSILDAALQTYISQASYSAAAQMQYFGNRAEQTIHVDLSYMGNGLASPDASSSAAEILPWVRDLATALPISLGDECGHTAVAVSNHKAWHELDGIQWGMASASRSESRSQLDCPPENGGGGSGGGGGGGGGGEEWVICYWTEFRDQYGNLIEVIFQGCYPL